jgi:hypothetical protein
VDAVRKVQKAGKVCVLDIDVQGVQKIKQTDISPHLIFIAPPSTEQLEARLRGRCVKTRSDRRGMWDAWGWVADGWMDGWMCCGGPKTRLAREWIESRPIVFFPHIMVIDKQTTLNTQRHGVGGRHRDAAGQRARRDRVRGAGGEL